jgi:hypothetical protein
VLCEQVARSRPGVSLLHDYALDSKFLDLFATYRAVYPTALAEPARSRAISLYSPPSLLGAVGEAVSAADLAMSKGMMSRGGGPAITKEDGVWVASGLRWIERTASQLGETAEEGETQTPTTEGIEDALKFVSGVLERHRTKL